MSTPTEALIRRWRQNPAAFIAEVLVDPESKRPFVLLDAEVQFLRHALTFDAHGRLKYSELLYSCPKKSGKTTFAALFTLTLLLLYGGNYPEATICANDYDQSVARVFTMIRRIVECSSALRRMAKITADTISFPELKATISAIPSDFAGAAGGAQNIAVFDELWGFVHESSRRLFDEMVPVPTKQISCRLTVSYAGWHGESQLLEELHVRGLQQPKIGTDLHAGDGLLMFWSHVPIAPWQTEAWLAEARRALRPAQFQRMICNEWVSAESSFIDLATYDQCVDANHRPVASDRALPVWIGVDASTKHDSTALAVVTFDRAKQQVRLVAHKIILPSQNRPIDFEAAVETTLLNWALAFKVKACLFDPYQMVGSAQRLTRDGVKMEEFPQTSANLTQAAENLYSLINSRGLVAYPDSAIRTAVGQAQAIESSRGWRIGKVRQSHRIDVVVALAMACLAAVRGQGRSEMRMALPTGGDVCGPLVEVDPNTGRRLERPRTRLVRDADGNLQLVNGDNSCWTSEELRYHGVLGLY
jgi:phage terminase large subunit-like protein